MELNDTLFTDTDSLTYEIETEDAYKDFWSNKDKFDNSEYPFDLSYFDKSNKKVIGKFKDEVSGIPINEFLGLRSEGPFTRYVFKDPIFVGSEKRIV